MQKFKDSVSEIVVTKNSMSSFLTRMVSNTGSWFKNLSRPSYVSVEVREVQYTIPEKMSTHSAIIELLNKGKNYDHAKKIVHVTHDYQLELAAFNTDKVQVLGNSVWLDMED
jgi:predicted transcriptional regulator